MARRSLALSLTALCAALLLSTASVEAQSTDDARARARAAYAEGQRLFEAGDYAGALAQFEAAWAAVDTPPPVVLLGIASAEEHLGRTAEAIESLNRYLVVRPDAPDRAAVEERIRGMGGTVAPPNGTIGFDSEPSGAAIVIDGTNTSSVTPADVSVTPGEHTYELALDGYDLASGTVTVASSGRAEVSTALTATEEVGLMDSGDVFGGEDEEEETEPTPAPSNDPSAATWVMFTVTGVALVTGTIFGFLALSRQSDFDVMPTAAAADEGEIFALVADLSFGVTIAAGITAIVLYATDRPSTPPAAGAARERGPSIAVAPMIGPTVAGATVGGSF
jgi:hypothetical protein